LAFFVALLNHSSSRLQDLQENHESVLSRPGCYSTTIS
jgi:hypothetical protein